MLLGEFKAVGNEAELRKIILEQMQSGDVYVQPGLPDLEEKEATIYSAVSLHIQQKKVFRLWQPIGIAASLLIMMSVGGYFILNKKSSVAVVTQVHDILPGTNSATLTLGNGQQITLRNKPKGQLAVQGNMAVVKTAEGILAYKATGGSADNEVQMNTVTTKRKEQYRVVLPDGTNVWLNAASSISYPTVFTGDDRRVSITGEAYFEVTHNAAKPFKVVSDGQTIEVLGTHFNINSYVDEPAIKTTLLQGKVKVYNKESKDAIVLTPGQEASNNKSAIIVTNANADAAVAWKNNLFQFTGSDIKTLMRQFARWYDVDVIYEGKISEHDEFTGKISRNVKASAVFELLKRYQINVKVEGRKVIIKGN